MLKILFGASLILALNLAISVPLEAATITVNSKLDAIANDGHCTLREAIMAANKNTASGSAPGECVAGEATNPVTDLPVDEIVFDDLPGSPDIYQLAIAGNAEDDALQGDLDILESVNLRGNGQFETIIHGKNLDRVFHIIVSQFTIAVIIDEVTIQHGYAVQGGGIYNFVGVLTIQNSIVNLNEVRCLTNCLGGIAGAGIFNEGGTLILVRPSVAASPTLNSPARRFSTARSPATSRSAQPRLAAPAKAAASGALARRRR